MSEDKKELNENELDKVTGGACIPAEFAAESDDLAAVGKICELADAVERYDIVKRTTNADALK